jgi:hypothetical protein
LEERVSGRTAATPDRTAGGGHATEQDFGKAGRAMPMREECKHFQSRTYDSGEVARFCILDLAPEAPWRCPDDCPSYAPRLADVGWAHGSLIEPRLEPMPDVPDDEAVRLLDQAADIVNAVGPEVLAEVREEDAVQERRERRWWRRRR